jgi:hypothetical protein
LLQLVLKVLILRFCLAGGFDLLDSIELGQPVAGLYRRAVRDEMGEGQVAALAGLAADLRRHYRVSANGLHDAGRTNAAAHLTGFY